MDASRLTAPPAESGAIVSRQFCVSHPVDLVFTTKARGVKKGRLAAVDASGKVIYRVESPSWNFNNRRFLVDAATGSLLLSLKPKRWSLHGRWEVFMGNSSDPKDLLFSVKSSSVFQIRAEQVVLLAANTKEDVCDFKIKGSYSYRKRSCRILKGETSMVVAQMSKMSKERKAEFGKHAFRVTVNQNTDSCFIAALVVILHERDEEASRAAAASTMSSDSSSAAASTF